MIKDATRYAKVELDYVTFTLDKNNPVPCEHVLQGYDDIYDAYRRPSEYKVDIWRDWEEWFYRNDGHCVISSKNCNFFSIEGFVTDRESGKRYFAYITYANNRLYEVLA